LVTILEDVLIMTSAFHKVFAGDEVEWHGRVRRHSPVGEFEGFPIFCPVKKPVFMGSFNFFEKALSEELGPAYERGEQPIRSPSALRLTVRPEP